VAQKSKQPNQKKLENELTDDDEDEDLDDEDLL